MNRTGMPFLARLRRLAVHRGPGRLNNHRRHRSISVADF
jgi:hypothetical protein